MDDSRRARAQEIYNELVSTAEEIDNEDAEDYIDSVTTKAENIIEWVQENDHATEKQIESLQNMHDGLIRWAR